MTEHELIVCIVNTGFSDVVMDAAREQGARGGTVIHARGTANKEAEEFFHITIQPDKEIVMILVPSEIKDKVLHALYQAAGLKTAGQGISFSLPVTNAVGLSSGTVETLATKDEKKEDKTEPEPEKAEAPAEPEQTDEEKKDE